MNFFNQFKAGMRSTPRSSDDWGFRLMVLFVLVGMACLLAVLYFG